MAAFPLRRASCSCLYCAYTHERIATVEAEHLGVCNNSIMASYMLPIAITTHLKKAVDIRAAVSSLYHAHVRCFAARKTCRIKREPSAEPWCRLTSFECVCCNFGLFSLPESWETWINLSLALWSAPSTVTCHVSRPFKILFIGSILVHL